MPPAVRARLLSLVAGRLSSRQVRFTLVGAGALAVHGASGAPASRELLVVSRAVLAGPFWDGLEDAHAAVAEGDADARFAGSVEVTRGAEAPVRVLVGKMSWQQDLLARSRVRRLGDDELPVASVVDLILLGLYAGGDEDARDVERLLAVTDRESITEQVDGRLNQLPPECARLWRRVLTGS